MSASGAEIDAAWNKLQFNACHLWLILDALSQV